MKRVKHDSNEYIIPRLPDEARESMKRASSVPSKRKYIRHQDKEEIRRNLDNLPLEDV